MVGAYAAAKQAFHAEGNGFSTWLRSGGAAMEGFGVDDDGTTEEGKGEGKR